MPKPTMFKVNLIKPKITIVTYCACCGAIFYEN